MDIVMQFVAFATQVLLLLVLGSIVFDIIHFILHVCMRSKSLLLQKIGSLHAAHHDFLNERLKINERFSKANIVYHVIPESLTQLAVILCGLFIFSWKVVAIASAIVIIAAISVICMRGRDGHHQEMQSLLSIPASLRVCSTYHAYHHAHPNYFFGSWIRLIDMVLGTAVVLRGKRVVLTGSGGALGSAMERLLRAQGVERIICLKHGIDYIHGDEPSLDEPLRSCDILVLCHGSKDGAMKANYDTFVALIEKFRSSSTNRFEPPEVWAIGSEIEFHPFFGRSLREYAKSKRQYADKAISYYKDPRLTYRHIVPATFSSKMGPGPISGAFVARITLFLIKRGFKYIPVTYTGLAFVNYLVFRCRKQSTLFPAAKPCDAV
jgi:hypothetical protein